MSKTEASSQAGPAHVTFQMRWVAPLMDTLLPGHHVSKAGAPGWNGEIFAIPSRARSFGWPAPRRGSGRLGDLAGDHPSSRWDGGASHVRRLAEATKAIT